MRNGIQRRAFGILLCTGMTMLSVPSFAGFEFSAPPAPVRSQQAPAEQMPAPVDTAMPVVPMAPVSMEPLDAPMNDKILSAPVSHQQGNEEVYIRRQRNVSAITPAPNQAINTEGLLKATNNLQPVSIAPETLKAAYAGERLVINPYPLQNKESAPVRDTGMGALSVEQAMMEQAGALRPVATPGSSGEIDRARISARYNRDTKYLNRDQVVPRDPASSYAGSTTMTPIPGGEGQPLESYDSAALAPLPPVAPAPLLPARQSAVPQPSQAQGRVSGYSEAVGFGRDLPLALALSQVIPPEYSYAFGQGTDAGANVSWQGGKPWDQVLNDMLAPAGMKAVIQNNQVTIQSPNA